VKLWVKFNFIVQHGGKIMVKWPMMGGRKKRIFIGFEINLRENMWKMNVNRDSNNGDVKGDP
jgi:hypothetical protein